MKLEDIRKVGIIGAGLMGHGIALGHAMGGYPVVINDISEEALEKAMDNIRDDLDIFVEEDMLSRDEANAALARISATKDMAEFARDVDFVTEAVTENLELKKEIFNKLDTLCPERTIIASNTSALLISEFGAGVKRQDKIVIAHWWNPPHIIPVVEVVKGPRTSDETFNLTYDLHRKISKVPVRLLKELPGYLGGRMQVALMRETYSLLEQGVATPEDIDLVQKGSFGFRMAVIGQLLTFDLAGLDLSAMILPGLLPTLSNAPELPEVIKSKVEAGELGRKTGKGVYEYSKEEWDEKARQRDKDMLKLLKTLYWQNS